MMYRSDLAIDFLKEDGFGNQRSYEKDERFGIIIERLVLHEDDEAYQKKKGNYVSLSFENIEIENIRKHLIPLLTQEIKRMMSYLHCEHPKKVLVCGLGNALLSCDSLGPLLQDQLIVSAHLEDVQELSKVALLIPRVKAQTGIETFDIIDGTCQKFQPDLLIVVDALATRNLSKVNHVIQLSSAGIQPGSGVGNRTKGLDAKSLGRPMICLGVPTVVDCASITYDVLNLMENYFANQIHNPHTKLKVGKREENDLELEEAQKEMLFGEFGKLDDAEKRYLLDEVIQPSALNMIVMDKNTDLAIKELAKVITHALNDVFLEE